MNSRIRLLICRFACGIVAGLITMSLEVTAKASSSPPKKKPVAKKTRTVANDPEKGRLPIKGKDVSDTHPDRAAIAELMLAYVKSLESRDLKGYLAVVTPRFETEMEFGKRWSSLRTTSHPELIRIEDLILMDYLGSIFVRFSVLDRRSEKVTRLEPQAWYILKKSSSGAWKIDRYFAYFDPDGGP